MEPAAFPSNPAHFPLHNQDIALFPLPFHLLLEPCKIQMRLPGFVRQNTKDDDSISKGERPDFPKPLVGLGEIGQAAKLFDETFLQRKKFLPWNPSPVIVRKRDV
jgi:hypothetical protein